MKKFFLFLGFILVAFVLGILFLRKDEKVPVKNNGDFIGYNIGQEITFAEGGNSFQFVKMEDGWSHQEPEYRCTYGDTATARFFIPETDGKDLKLEFTAFGVFAPEESYQKVTVWANNVKVADWNVAGKDVYVAIIPAKLITDDKLTLRLDIAKPYTPPVDVRRLGMGVSQMKIDKIYGAQTKRKIGKWLKGILNPNGDLSVFDEKKEDKNKD